MTWYIATKDGKSVSGLLIEETGDNVLIRDANGKDTFQEPADAPCRREWLGVLAFLGQVLGNGNPVHRSRGGSHEH